MVVQTSSLPMTIIYGAMFPTGDLDRNWGVEQLTQLLSLETLSLNLQQFDIKD